MNKHPQVSDYASASRRFVTRFPLLEHIVVQTTFWIAANVLLVVILHLQSLIIGEAVKLQVATRFGPTLLVAVSLGFLQGLLLAFPDYYLHRTTFRKLPLGIVILIRTGLSLLTTIAILLLIVFLFDNYLEATIQNDTFSLTRKSWQYLLCLLIVYYLVMTILISYMNQVKKKFGPGISVPLLLGKYRKPREEQRIFLFMDLKSSTSIAEKLGHIQYSEFIQDCFMDINVVLQNHSAEVYQYVGDEIVVTWKEDEGLRNATCLTFFFDCKRLFKKRSEHYLRNFGLIPEFKAGLHSGSVTVAEIGDLKKDSQIPPKYSAYHGDALNTAARIQGLCNEFTRQCLISETLLGKISVPKSITVEHLGAIQLRGKTEMIGIASIRQTRNDGA